MAHTILDPDGGPQVLTELAVVLAKHACTAASICSCRVTAASLTSSLWFRAMPVLASLAPVAVAAAGCVLDVLDRSLRRVEGAVPAPTRCPGDSGLEVVPASAAGGWARRKEPLDCETARSRYPPLLLG